MGKGIRAAGAASGLRKKKKYKGKSDPSNTARMSGKKKSGMSSVGGTMGRVGRGVASSMPKKIGGTYSGAGKPSGNYPGKGKRTKSSMKKKSAGDYFKY